MPWPYRQVRCAYIAKICVWAVTLLLCWIWIFHTIVVHGLIVCHDLGSRSYLKDQVYCAHISKICVWAITPYFGSRSYLKDQVYCAHISKICVWARTPLNIFILDLNNITYNCCLCPKVCHLFAPKLFTNYLNLDDSNTIVVHDQGVAVSGGYFSPLGHFYFFVIFM